MKTPQNVLNVRREPWHKQRDGDTTDWWLQPCNDYWMVQLSAFDK